MRQARSRHKILTLICGILLPSLLIAAVADDQVREADRLLAGSTLAVGQAQQALALYETALAAGAGDQGPVLERLARVCFILGDMAPESQRESYYEKGLGYAERLLQAQPGGVAGYYWKAMHQAGLADTGGKLKGRKLLPRIMEGLERSLRLDETYDHAGAHRVLGRIYYEAPGPPFSVGDLQKSLAHLSAAARLAPEVSTNHLYLAETLLKLDQPAQARQELERVLTATRPAVQPQGLEDDRREARRLLGELPG